MSAAATGERGPGSRLEEAATRHDPELLAEQAHLGRAHRGLAEMRTRAEQLLAELRAAGAPDLDYEAALVRRVHLLGESPRPLLFGRIDEEAGSTWHVGRRHVEDAGGEVVLDWRTPVAAAFYRARPGEPLGLRRRRQIMVESARVVAVADDLFGEAGGEAGTARLRGGDALLAELERARTGEMLDIVATIQAEQDEVIRGPLEGLSVVQGGPGTGKTAVALHRAAFLLYNHPELSRSGVLVVGPSRAFLRYIAQVLPALGEEAVLQVTVADLAPRVRLRGEDAPFAARTKGDPRMAPLLAAALAGLRQPLERAVPVAVRSVRVVFEPEPVNELVELLASRQLAYRAGRSALRSRLVAHARERLREAGRYEGSESWFARELLASKELAQLLDQLWPPVSAPGLVNELLTRPPLLARAAQDLLEPEEVGALQRERPRSLGQAPWTAEDLALLDEAAYLLDGQARTYGHVVVDEAQDLSPMQLRMLARRAPRGSLTVLGDVAQASGPWSYQSWDEIVPHLPSPQGRREAELTLGYRAPAPVLELAARLLPVSAPAVRPPASVRRGRFLPQVLVVGETELAAAGLGEARRLAGQGWLVGLVHPATHLEAELAGLARRAPDVGRLDRDGISRPVTLVPAPAAKGLEFDATVVLEPAAIAGEGIRGLRLLYIALTRPIQQLVLVHARPLPGPLAGISAPSPAEPRQPPGNRVGGCARPLALTPLRVRSATPRARVAPRTRRPAGRAFEDRS